MFTETRRRRILQILIESENATVSVERLSEMLGVSTMTVRRDLDWLEERSLLQRVHGGAIAVESAPTWKPFGERRAEFSREKQAIAWLAAQLVNDGERIIIDSGTTTHLLARHLDCRKDLVAITNSLPAAEELARCPDITTITLGGLLKPREMCTVGPMVTEVLARLSVDRLFLSAAGFDAARGVTDPDLREVEVKRAMMAAAREVVLVADSSKWGQVALAQVAPLSAIRTLVTDADLPAEALGVIEATGVRVVMPTPEAQEAQSLLSEGSHP
jgi:DeoR/GlpR family transcriptional regulator of sugar metabolism